MTSDARVALVTGGGRGIGLGISRRLAAEGWRLAICGMRPEEAVAPALSALREAGAEVAYVQADIARTEDHGPLIDGVRQRFGALHALVNNAGVAPLDRADILEAGEDSFDRVIGINLRGPYFLTQRAARLMAEQARADRGYRGAVVFVTSISATVASVNRGDYCLSKAGLAMAARLWAVRLSEYGIPVYEVRPGVISTDMTAAVAEKYDRLFADGLALERRWGTPDDVGSAVAALLRGDLPYATGQVVMVDGGMTVPVL